tara:strand:+ start:1063 stop:1398 length:336 start_codon:yes stop_codon:yes gene_type:complete
MAYWVLNTYTRPNLDKEFYIRRTVGEVKTLSAIGSKIVELEEAGKITHYSIHYSEDTLTQKVKIGFDTKETYDTFKSFCDGQDEFTTTKSDFIVNESLSESYVESESEPSV